VNTCYDNNMQIILNIKEIRIQQYLISSNYKRCKYVCIQQEDFYKVAIISTKGDQSLSKLISEAVTRSISINDWDSVNLRIVI